MTNQPADMVTLRQALEHIRYEAFRAPIYTVIDGESRELSLAKLSTALDELAAARERIAAMEAWQERAIAIMRYYQSGPPVYERGRYGQSICQTCRYPDGHLPDCQWVEINALLADKAPESGGSEVTE